MDKSFKIMSGIFVVVMVLLTIVARVRINNLLDENQRLLNNQEILLTEKNAIMAESRKYQTSDSLNAIKVGELRLTLEEYKKFRASDLALIDRLEVDKRDLQRIISTQTETMNNLKAELRDTLVPNNGTTIELKTFSYKSKWTDVDGLIDLKSNEVSLDIKNREDLILVETIEYKRFLGFLWKTKKVKNRTVDIVSRNPNTEIMNASYERIEK